MVNGPWIKKYTRNGFTTKLFPSANNFSICFRLLSLSPFPSVNCLLTDNTNIFRNKNSPKYEAIQIIESLPKPSAQGDEVWRGFFISLFFRQKLSVSYGLSCGVLIIPCGHRQFSYAYENHAPICGGVYVADRFFFYLA